MKNKIRVFWQRKPRFGYYERKHAPIFKYWSLGFVRVVYCDLDKMRSPVMAKMAYYSASDAALQLTK